MANSGTYEVTIEGVSDLLMHNGRTADPLDVFSKAMKKLAAKRKKTDDDLAFLSNLEWWAGLYVSPRTGLEVDEACNVKAVNGVKIVMPAHVLESAIRAGARKLKMGKEFSAGVLVEGDGEFSHSSIKKPLVDMSVDL